MAESTKYTLLLQNNASKEFFLFSGLTNGSTNHLYCQFEIELGCPDGEYTYVVFVNNRDDVEVEFKTPLLETILHVEGYEDVVLKDLQPGTGLLRIGEKMEYDNTYDEGNDNNTIFYYDN